MAGSPTSSVSRQRRYLVAVLPWAALERQWAPATASPAAPWALVRTQQSRCEVVLPCPVAWQAGIRSAMSATEARAMLPSLVVAEQDVTAEQREWQRLARLGYTYAPLAGYLPPPPQRRLVDPYAQPALWVDIAGTQRLHGSESRVAQRLCEDLAAQGYTAFVAVADTPSAARAAASVLYVEAQQQQRVPPNTEANATPARQMYLLPPGRVAEALAAVPLSALPFPGPLLEDLAGLALETLGDLLRISRPNLAARFGEEVAVVLAEVLGEVTQPLLPEPVDARLRVLAPLEGPTDQRDAVLFCLKRMCDALHARLLRDAEGARVLAVQLARASAGLEPLRAEISLSVPQRRAKVLLELVRAQVERFDFSHPVDEVALTVERREPLPCHAATLFDEAGGDFAAAAGVGEALSTAARQGGAAPSPEGLGVLVDRLREHLGPHAVQQWQLRESHVPEQAFSANPPSLEALTTGRATASNSDRKPANKQRKQRNRHSRRDRARTGRHGHARESSNASAHPPLSPRPARLLEPPVRIHLRELGGRIQFEFAGQCYEVTQRTGPERLFTAWWSESPTSRDYLLLHTRQGPVFWAYRDATTKEFYLHGLFD